MNITKKNVMEEVENQSSEEILTKEEKDYLSVVIKPFRNRVSYIAKKYGPSRKSEYIKIFVNDDKYIGAYRDFILLYFKTGTMFQGMEINEEYTPNELGI